MSEGVQVAPSIFCSHAVFYMRVDFGFMEPEVQATSVRLPST